MPATIGRIVIYKVDSVTELPAVMVAVFGPTCANLRVLTDGPDSPAWKTSVLEGTEPGTWHWPARVGDLR